MKTRLHWPEYLIEAALLGLFMISASVSVALIYHPTSPLQGLLGSELQRRTVVGIVMGLTAIGLIYSPWGGRSGAHMNPAVTLAFLRLGKITPLDALLYVVAQFVGATAVMLLVVAVAPPIIADPAVNFVVTVPGSKGAWAAFAAETAISFGLMTVVLHASNRASLMKWTGTFAGVAVAIYIILESPFSGMSMNPARTFGSAFAGRIWDALWVYFTAPLAGMLLAAELYLFTRGRSRVFCCKLHHPDDKPCIFNCRMNELQRASGNGNTTSAKPLPQF